MEEWKKGSQEGRGRKQKEGKDSLFLVSLAAVFEMSRSAPPKKQLLTTEPHSFYCVCEFLAVC